jgi:methionyl-tRNA formyltransferase
MNIVFFGSSNVALPVLEILHEQYSVVLVVTTPDAKVGRKQTITPSPVGLLAAELGLPLYKPEKLSDSSVIDTLQKTQADVFVVLSYGKIIPESILNIPPHKSINIHPSLLPKYRGPTPMPAALLNGDTETGTTIMLMDKEMDHGPILAQRSVPIDPDDTFLTLQDKLSKLSAHLLIDTLPGYIQGDIKPQEQNHAEATYCKLQSKEDGKINWQQTATQIYNQFRALYPWPGIWTTWNGQILKITFCVPTAETSSEAPGTVLPYGMIACGEGTVLQINQLQLSGKNETDIQSFLNGYTSFTGSQLS